MRTHKQIEAQKRNHLILRLRGAYALMFQLGSKDGMIAVDNELIKLKAETETAKREQYYLDDAAYPGYGQDATYTGEHS